MSRSVFSQIVNQNFHFESCSECCIYYGIPETLNDQCRDNGKGVYCPNGHKQYYSESEVRKLKKQVEREKRLRLETEGQLTTERGFTRKLRAEKSALKGVATKMKKRVSAGICVCCNRTFKNVARHMKSKHPGYIKEKK